MIKIPDIIQLNDWGHKKFLRIMIAIHLVMLGTIGLDFTGLEIPILRQVVGFVYLTFLPGVLILRLLNLHKLGVTQTVILSAGLSISFLMFSGFFLNSILAYFHVDAPFAFWNVIFFINILVIILIILSYRMNKYYQYELPHLKISRWGIYLILLPILSIVGTYFINFHENNIFLMILIVLIALIPILVAYKKITPELFPLTIFVISVSLLFHRSLISMYLTGWDVHAEYYFHKLVVDNAYWDSGIYSNINAMLSIVILPSVYSYFLNMDGAWIFKIVYPIIFSLVPLGLYRVYQLQIKSDAMAFYSVFFFISFFNFFKEMLSLARQEIAELYLVLLLFLMVQETLNKNIRNFMLLIFGASLITSHYGLSYIYIILIIIIYLLSMFMIRSSNIKGISLFEYNFKELNLNYFVVFYFIFALLWYINTSSSSAFNSIINIGEHVYSSIFTEFFNPENRDRNVLMAFGISEPVVSSFWRQAHRNLQLITQFLIIIGFFKIIFFREFNKLKAEYFFLIMASFVILLLSVLPFSAKSFNMTRIYQITLFALSPLFMVGGIFLIDKLIKIINLNQKHIVPILILFILIPYFLFNTGFVYEITGDVPNSFSLGMERMKKDNITKVSFYNTYTPEQDVYSARWYHMNKDANKKTFADRDSRLHVMKSYGLTLQDDTHSPFKRNEIYEYYFRSDYYIYLNTLNICDNTFVESSIFLINTSALSPLFNISSKVYSNGCGDIYEK